MVNNLLQEKAEKEAALAELHRQILAGHDNPDALRQQVQELEQELSAIQSKLDDKQEKLSEADRKLDALREEMTAMKERTEELRQEAHRYSDTIRQGADTVLRNALLENMVSEFSERVEMCIRDSSFSFTEICQFQQLRVFLDNIQTAHWLFQCDKKQIKLLSKFGSCGVETDITVFFYLFNQLHFGSHPSFNFSLFISKVVVDGSH